MRLLEDDCLRGDVVVDEGEGWKDVGVCVCVGVRLLRFCAKCWAAPCVCVLVSLLSAGWRRAWRGVAWRGTAAVPIGSGTSTYTRRRRDRQTNTDAQTSLTPALG